MSAAKPLPPPPSPLLINGAGCVSKRLVNSAALLLDLTTLGSRHDVSIVWCLQETNAALAAYIDKEVIGGEWGVAHMDHINLFTAWRRVASLHAQAT